MSIFIKIDRFMAWILFVGIVFYFISGYGMTKGVIDSNFASKIHLDYLTYVIFIAFIFHSAFAIRLAFIRWSIWQSYGKYLWLTGYILLIFGLVYFDKFYSNTKSDTVGQSENTSNEISNSNSANNEASTNSSILTDSGEKTFTIAELAKYDGSNGQPGYVAVDGDVYDLTSVFQEGKHYSHFAGKELTNAFYSYHAKKALAKYPIVGKLK